MMDRRRFMSLSCRTLAAGLLGATALPGRARADEREARAADASSWPDLVIARGPAKEALPRALAAIGGLGRFVPPGKVVAIKPNASFPAPPEWGATTHPEVLAALIAACLEAEARRVLVVDHTMGDAARCFERTGTAAAVAPFERAKLVSLDDHAMYQEVAIPQARALHRAEIAQAVLRADAWINLPTAKSHNATGVSFGLKNLMGLVWDRQTFHRDMDIHAGIADLARVLRPQLTILDAAYLLKTGGPTGPGDVEAYGGIVVGSDPVAVDAFAAGLTTWNRQMVRPGEIPHLRMAAEQGTGTLDLGSLKIQELT
jgi:uncharacterized protein (DUF362 family)